MKKTVLVTDRLAAESWVTLDSQNFIQLKRSQATKPTAEELKGVHGLLIRSRTVVDEALLKSAPELQVIVTSTSGFDHIDLDACQQWGITVMFTPEANVASAAELSWSLILACCRKMEQARTQVLKGDWKRDLLIGTELSHKTLGIVGLGRIGSRMATIAKAFQMPVIAYDPFVEEDVFEKYGAQRVAFEELLKSSDILSFHVPKTAMTKNMLNRSHFEYIHRGVILVNTSRGTVIQENDLIEALQQGWVGAAGLDVFEKEPLPKEHRLMQMPNVVLTPHIGANTHEAYSKSSEAGALKILRFFIDGSTSDTLPPKAAWYGQPNPWA